MIRAAALVVAAAAALPASAADPPRGAARYARLARVMLMTPALRTAVRTAPVAVQRRLARCRDLVAAQPRTTSKKDLVATFEVLLVARTLAPAHARFTRAIDRVRVTAPVLVRWRRAIHVTDAAYALVPRLDLDPCHALEAWRRSGWQRG